MLNSCVEPAHHTVIKDRQNRFWFTGLEWDWGLSISPIILVRSQGWEPVCSIHPNSPDLFPSCFHYDVPRLCLPCKPHNVPRAMYLAFLPDSFSSRAFLRHTLSTRRSSDHLEKVLTFCASWGPREKKALIFIELIFICIIYLYPVLVGVANFYNKNPKSQWPDATIKAYFLLITKPKMQRTGRDWRKRQTTPDWWAAGLINKGIFLPDFVLGGHEMSKFLHTPATS